MWQKSIPQKRSPGLSETLKYGRRRTNDCGSCWKRRYEPRSDKRLPSRGRNPKPSPKNPDAKQESSMGAAIAGPFPPRLMKLSKYRCRPAVRDAEADWKRARPFLSSKPRFRNRGWSALSFAFVSDAAGVADDECKGDIHGKPLMPSAVRRRN